MVGLAFDSLFTRARPDLWRANLNRLVSFLTSAEAATKVVYRLE